MLIGFAALMVVVGGAIPTYNTLDKHGFHSWRLSSPGFMKCHDQTLCLERVLH